MYYILSQLIQGMFIPPVVMMNLEKTATFVHNPWLKAPTTVLLTGLCLTFSTPACCAFFPQRAAIELKDLEPALQENLKKQFPAAKGNTPY